MRPLSPEDVAALRWRPAPGEPIPDWIREASERLLKRGVAGRKVVERDGKLFARWFITPLGQLALRVALPFPAVRS